MRFTLCVLVLLSVASAALAAATVEDIRNRDRTYGAQPTYPRPVGDADSRNAGAGVQPAVQPTPFSQLQALQDEVRELRGLVEEQANEIRLLKKRQLDDYQNIDGRLTGLHDKLGAMAAPAVAGDAAGNPAEEGVQIAGDDVGDVGAAGDERHTSGGTSGEAAPIDRQTTQPPAAVSRPDPDAQQYDAAYELLKQRKVDLAEKEFRAYVAAHPGGARVANAHYWLGEIALLQNRLEPARVEFATVVEKFPQDRKIEDAMFKLGKVYHLQGDSARAKTLLKKVAGGDSSAARLAQAYLRDNF